MASNILIISRQQKVMDKAIRKKYTVVIGLEVHAQLSTSSKIFSSDSTAFGAKPNTNISVITLGHPGSMPKLNKKVVELAVKMGLACHSEIARECIFDRKNYFYPDLPKGYQITQDRTPICKGGFLSIKTSSGEEKKIRLHKIHMEEDAGKSIHLSGESDTLVDLNRAGVPLIEIVTEPDLRSAEEAATLLSEVRKIVRYLDICDGNMEEGSLRCDANISVMLKGSKTFGNKVEVKNMNSIKNVQKAIEYEVERQIMDVEAGIPIISETRLFDVATGTTAGMRTKETLTDYRYFPEPDLSPLVISEEWLDKIKAGMDVLPQELYQEFTQKYQLPEYDAAVLTESREYALYFKELCRHTDNYKSASNWMMGPVKSFLNETGQDIGNCPVAPTQLARLIGLIDEGKVNYTAACQQVFPELIKKTDESPAEIAHRLNLIQDANSSNIQSLVDEVLESFPEKVAEYKKGKKGLIGMFMGELMKRSKGKIDPKTANKLLCDSLSKVPVNPRN